MFPFVSGSFENSIEAPVNARAVAAGAASRGVVLRLNFVIGPRLVAAPTCLSTSIAIRPFDLSFWYLVYFIGGSLLSLYSTESLIVLIYIMPGAASGYNGLQLSPNYSVGCDDIQ